MDAQTLATKNLYELATRQHSGADAITIAEGVGEIERRLAEQAEDAEIGRVIRDIPEGGMFQIRHDKFWKITTKGQDIYFSLFSGETATDALRAAGLLDKGKEAADAE